MDPAAIFDDYQRRCCPFGLLRRRSSMDICQSSMPAVVLRAIETSDDRTHNIRMTCQCLRWLHKIAVQKIHNPRFNMAKHQHERTRTVGWVWEATFQTKRFFFSIAKNHRVIWASLVRSLDITHLRGSCRSSLESLF